MSAVCVGVTLSARSVAPGTYSVSDSDSYGDWNSNGNPELLAKTWHTRVTISSPVVTTSSGSASLTTNAMTGPSGYGMMPLRPTARPIRRVNRDISSRSPPGCTYTLVRRSVNTTPVRPMVTSA